MSYSSGFGGYATINGTQLPVVSWSVNNPADLVVFKNSTSGNHPNRVATYTDFTCTIVIDWDEANQPFAAPLSIVAGQIVAAVKLYATASSFWGLTNMVVAGTPMQMVRDGKISTRVDLSFASGTIQYPGGGAPS